MKDLSQLWLEYFYFNIESHPVEVVQCPIKLRKSYKIGI